MNIIYYSEVNLICIIVLLLLANQMRYKSDQFSSENRTFSLILWTTIITCASDMVAGICRGQFFSGARMIIEISNLIFYESLSIISFLWMIYVFTKLKIIKNYNKKLLVWAIPFIVISIATFINPFTNFFFTVDENNLYVRNIGVYFHWIVIWFYLLTSNGIIAYKIIKEQNKQRRKEIILLMSFIIAPAIAAIIQMLFYGVSCSQVGITVSMVLISSTDQNNQILTDALTGLNNRHSFNKYRDNYMHNHIETELFIMMIDINSFKQVNDKFGHIEGDRALADVADVVKQSCEESPAKLFACRYGGDEFLIAGYNCQQDEFMELKKQINTKLEEKNIMENYPYVLSVSMGTAGSICQNADDIDNLLRLADEAMYDEKSKKKTRV